MQKHMYIYMYMISYLMNHNISSYQIELRANCFGGFPMRNWTYVVLDGWEGIISLIPMTNALGVLGRLIIDNDKCPGQMYKSKLINSNKSIYKSI